MPPNAKSSQLNSSSLSATKKPQQNTPVNKAPPQPPKPILTYEQMLKLADNVQKDKTKPTVPDAIAPKHKSMPPPPPPPQVEPKKAIITQVKTANTAQKSKPKQPPPPPTNIQPKTNGTNSNKPSHQQQNKVTIDKEKQQPQSSSSTAASSNLCRLTPEQIAKLKQRAAPPVPGARPQSSMVNNGLNNNKLPNRTSASDLNNFRNGGAIPEKSKLARSNSFNDVQSKNVKKNDVNRSNGLLDKQQTGSKSSGVSAWDRITSDVKKSTVKNSNFFDFLKILKNFKVIYSLIR